MKPHTLPLVVAVAASAFLAGCDSKAPPPDLGYKNQPQVKKAPPVAEGPASNKKHQADFLNRIRSADPESKTIERAFLNDRNELGLILDRSVQIDDIPKLMRSMLTQMAKEFPNQDLTVVAYTPSNPPQTIGIARLNARTREMSYTPEK